MTMEAIGAGLGIVDKVAGIVAPRFNEELAQRYVKEHISRLEEWQNLISADPLNPDAITAFCVRLTTAAGYPAGKLAGATRPVPVELLDQFIVSTSAKIMESAIVASLMSKVAK